MAKIRLTWDEKYLVVKAAHTKALKAGVTAAEFWAKPENRRFKAWALQTKAMAAKAGLR
jgi:hypothetical protein